MIRNGENSAVEFERDTIEKRGLAKELVAFANLRGGSVLLGVEDDGSISGITRPSIEEWVMSACRDKVRPEIMPAFEVVRDAAPGRDMAVVAVDRGWTVHHVWHDQNRTYYLRVGTTCREASPEALERLVQQRGSVRAELRPISGTSIVDLDRRRLRDYFVRVREQEVPDDADDAGWTTLLVNTEFLAADREPPAATMAGLLLFGTNVSRFLAQAGIDAAAYPGTEKDYAVIQRGSCAGR